MYPESLQYDFNRDRGEVLQQLSTTHSGDTDLKTTYLVCTNRIGSFNV